MAHFVGIIHKDKKSDYGVIFPDFPGCISAGKTLQEAFLMGREALRGHIETMTEFGDELPSHASTIDEVQRHKLAKNALTFFVVDAYLPSKSRRINITLDQDLIDTIDSITDNRSAFFASAVRDKLEFRDNL